MLHFVDWSTDRCDSEGRYLVESLVLGLDSNSTWMKGCNKSSMDSHFIQGKRVLVGQLNLFAPARTLWNDLPIFKSLDPEMPDSVTCHNEDKKESQDWWNDNGYYCRIGSRRVTWVTVVAATWSIIIASAISFELPFVCRRRTSNAQQEQEGQQA